MKNSQEPVTQTEDKTEVSAVPTVEKKEEKTFTQEEVNAMVLKAEEKASKKYEGIDVEKYKKWEESQKTAEEKQQEENKKHLETENELTSAKELLSVYEAGVSKEEADFVQFKVSKMEGNFEDNLKEYLEKNPKYLQKAETSQTNGVPVKKISDNAEDGVMAILKQKHPNEF